MPRCGPDKAEPTGICGPLEWLVGGCSGQHFDTLPVTNCFGEAALGQPQPAGGRMLTAASPSLRGSQAGMSPCQPHQPPSGPCSAYWPEPRVLLTWWVQEGLG